MVDPINPFATLIRTLSRRKADAADAAPEPASVDTQPAGRSRVETARPMAALRSRLKSRLTAVGTVDSERARRTFVETILLWQLGDDLSRDPEFGDLVGRIADELHRDAQLRSRLTSLITALAA